MKNRFSIVQFPLLSDFCISKKTRRLVSGFMVFGLVSTSVFPTFAASPTTVLKPENGYGGASYNKIVGGTITSSSDLNSADIVAGAGGSALIDWHALNIGNGQSLNFSGSQFFNVVSGTDSSKIAGTLNANGTLWIFNQNGISFIDGAQINVGSLFAVAAKLANQQDKECQILKTIQCMGNIIPKR